MDMGRTGQVYDLHTMTVIPVDLQLFGGEKTEKATSKRRRDARQKGQVVQSKEFGGAVSLMAVFFGIHTLKGSLIERLLGFVNVIIEAMEHPDEIAETSHMLKVMGFTFETILALSLPLMIIALIAGVVMSYMQVGVLFTIKPIQPKLDKINPINGFKRLFSLRSIVELLKSVMKAVMLLYITGSYIVARQNDLLMVFNMSIMQIVALMWDMVFNLMIRAVFLLLVLAAMDYAYKKWQNEKDMMMSKQEIKDEYKMTEGDPQLKGKIKQKQREISMGRMMQEVPKADVIITNPTHYAVAVKYDPEKADAPKVVAKGKNLIAKNIRKIAEENDVPIVENKPLARALYAEVELGSFIPAELYHAVAEVLAYVYKLKKSS